MPIKRKTELPYAGYRGTSNAHIVTAFIRNSASNRFVLSGASDIFPRTQTACFSKSRTLLPVSI
jgi:hypothetical protein